MGGDLNGRVKKLAKRWQEAKTSRVGLKNWKWKSVMT